MNAKTISPVIAADFPSRGTTQQKLAHILKIITRLAALDESQPCQFRLTDTYIEVFAHAAQVSESTDPDGRELMIGCGVTLFRLKLALKYFGCYGAVELFPDLGNTRLVARCHHGSWHGSDSFETALFEAMTGSAPRMMSFGGAPVSEIAPGSLRHVIASDHAWLEYSHGESSRNRLSALTDSPRWTMPVSKSREPVDWADEDDDRAEGDPDDDDMAAIAAIKTKTDDKHGWLATGQIRACVQLQAEATGAASHFYDDAFRKRFLREELRTSLGRKGFVQAIVGLDSHPGGWKSASSAPRSVTITLRR